MIGNGVKIRTQPQAASLAIVLSAIAVMVAGCGGGDASTMSSAPTAVSRTGASVAARPLIGLGSPLTAKRLIAKADGICARLNARLTAAKDIIVTVGDTIRIAPRRAAIEQAAVAELSKLTPPARMTAAYQMIVAARQTVAHDIAAIGEATAANNVAMERALYASSAKALQQMKAIAQHNGFRACETLG